MKRTNELIVCKSLEEHSKHPYFILERYLSSEGTRTRVCGQTFDSEELAKAWRDHLVKNMEK